MKTLVNGRLIASVLVILAVAIPVSAKMIAPPPLALRVAWADSIVIGKVVGIEEKRVKAARYPNDKEGGEFVIANVKVESAFGNITNVKKLDTVRVGNPLPLNQPGLPRRGAVTPQLAKDQEVCLFLTPNLEGSFYQTPAYFDVLTKNNESPELFQKDMEEVKKLAKLLANPKASLASQDETERTLITAMVIQRSRDRRRFTGEVVEEPMDAELSKILLTNLANADWKNQNQPRGFQMTPIALFNTLGLTPADGWTPPTEGEKTLDEAQAWVKKNADSFRIKRFVEKPVESGK